MKRFISVKPAIAGLVIVAAAMAPAAQAEMVHSAILRANTGLILGVTSLKQDYKEFNDGLNPGLPAILDQESGSITGGEIGYSGMNLANNYYGRIMVRYNQGDTQYNGYTLLPPYTPVQATTHNKIGQINLRLGVGYGFLDRFAITPYLALGYYDWTRDLGYTEKYSHYYYGLGALFQYAVIDRLVIGVYGMAGETASASMTSDLTGSTYSLGSAPISRYGADVDFLLSRTLSFRVGVSQTRFRYGQSPADQYGFLEPNSTTNQTLYSAGLGLSF